MTGVAGRGGDALMVPFWHTAVLALRSGSIRAANRTVR
jgi:hypothetical protein